MAIQCGIVGLPNVGKSTLYKALTGANIAAENFPFCTIEPNQGTVAVPDPRLQAISALVDPERVLPTSMEFVDIAGLVAGASKGEGLGNQFLGHIRSTDAILHVVRCFQDDNIIHVAGKVNPLDDIAVIHTELALADLEGIQKSLNKISRAAKSGDAAAKTQMALLEKFSAQLDKGDLLSELTLSDEETQLAKSYNLLTLKPTLYVANVAEDGFDNNPLLDSVRALAAKSGADVIPVCAQIEAEIAELEAAEKIEFLQALNFSEPGLNRVIRASYHLLGLQTYFTAGKKEVRAWTVKQGATAPQAAGVIHTDFEKGFIRAEVIAYNDFIVCKGENGAKEAGKWRLEGKEYRVQDGDVIHFRFNV
jgi:hypothetical protein